MERKIALVVHKRKLCEPESDFAYWQQQSYQARLDALEEIRHDYFVWLASLQGNKEYVKPAFQKVYRIIKMSDLGSDNQ